LINVQRPSPYVGVGKLDFCPSERRLDSVDGVLGRQIQGKYVVCGSTSFPTPKVSQAFSHLFKHSKKSAVERLGGERSSMKFFMLPT